MNTRVSLDVVTQGSVVCLANDHLTRRNCKRRTVFFLLFPPISHNLSVPKLTEKLRLRFLTLYSSSIAARPLVFKIFWARTPSLSELWYGTKLERPTLECLGEYPLATSRAVKFSYSNLDSSFLEFPCASIYPSSNRGLQNRTRYALLGLGVLLKVLTTHSEGVRELSFRDEGISTLYSTRLVCIFLRWSLGCFILLASAHSRLVLALFSFISSYYAVVPSPPGMDS